MDKVCVIIRVYNRIEDLKYCVEIIRNTWKAYNYHVILSCNGSDDGYIIDDGTVGKADLLVEIKNNVGHFSGNSQLLLAALPHIPDSCDYTVILEADTWLYGDEVIVAYINKLKQQNAVWASAQFFRYVRNLATDFAIIETAWLKTHPEVFEFDKTPEYYVGNYLSRLGFKFIYITENMPINLPKYFRRFPGASNGRFFTFQKSKMVTHHVENLRGGMEEKKFYFNMVAGQDYFNISGHPSYNWERLKLGFFVALSILIPYKGWFFKTKKD